MESNNGFEIKGATEKDMREETAAWPRDIKDLVAYIKSAEECGDDYGKCVYACSMAAVATMNYMSHVLGMTGFQMSLADLDVVRRMRNIKGPFMLVTADRMLYPQHDVASDVAKALAEWGPWAAEQARSKLKKSDGLVHPDVAAHWKRLSEKHPSTGEGNA